MEKLQPVIKQIFWIMFALSALLILGGWYSASGNIAEQITAEVAKVNKAKTDCTQDVSMVPNGQWKQLAKNQNDEDALELGTAAAALREDQLSARVYPAQIRSRLAALQFNSPIGDPALRGEFGDLYARYFWDELQAVQPFVKGQGLVNIDWSNVKITHEDPSRWQNTPPRSGEIWAALEDIWLLRSMYDSIAEVNKGASQIYDAPLREILELSLRGGDPETAADSGGGGGSAGGGDMGRTGFGGGDMESMLGGGAAKGGGAWSKFEGGLEDDLLTAHFGNDPNGGSAGEMDLGGLGMDDEYGSPSGPGGNSGGNGDGDEESDKNARYVHAGDDLPYRTRAFLLKVKIKQQEIPRLLAELTNSKFPVEIIRVDMSFVNENGGGGMSGRGMGGGMGMENEDYGADVPENEQSSMSSMMSGGGRGGAGGFAGGIGSSGTSLDTLFQKCGDNRTDPRDPISEEERDNEAKGRNYLAKAMIDPDLAVVRVAGLMTMYRSEAETEAEQKSEEAAAQESSAIKIGGDSPSGTTPEGTTPEGTTPEGTTPEGTTPEGTTPEGTTPEGTTPEGTTPEGTTPEGTTPEGTTPEGTTPQNNGN